MSNDYLYERVKKVNLSAASLTPFFLEVLKIKTDRQIHKDTHIAMKLITPLLIVWGEGL